MISVTGSGVEVLVEYVAVSALTSGSSLGMRAIMSAGQRGHLSVG